MDIQLQSLNTTNFKRKRLETNREKQQLKAQKLHQLHHSGEMLILPNVWDPLGAILIEQMNYPVIATASAAIAYSNGYDDGEHLPFEDLLPILTKIVNSVDLPVTADIESGYASNETELNENIKRLIETGIVGINIEDTDKSTGKLIPTDVQCDRIRLIREVSDEMGVSLFINARIDAYIHGDQFKTVNEKLEESLKRGMAYKDATADCLFPIAIRQESDIKTLVDQLQMPINVLTIPGIPELKTLKEIGVARVSLGPSLLKLAIKSMKNLAEKLHHLEGLSEITGNEITSEYLRDLVSK